MSVVKLLALTNLKNAIATAVPAFRSITVQIEPSPVLETFPNLEIIIGNALEFEPDQRELQADLGGNAVVWNVGNWYGPIQLRICATSTFERWTLEQAVTNYLMSRPGSPGVVVVPVTESPQLSWAAAFEYDSAQMFDQRAQERQYECAVLVNAMIPVLVTESPVYQIDHLFCGLTEDMVTHFTPSTAVPPAVEIVEIHVDGTITPA